MTLYDIDIAMASLVDPETGEIRDFAAWQELHLARDQKLENTALWIKNLTAEAKAVKEEADALTKRRKALEGRAESLKRLLDEALGGQRFETSRCAISWRRSTALDVSDNVAAVKWLEENGHGDMLTYAEPAIDKRGVAELVKRGESVPGVALTERQNLQIK